MSKFYTSELQTVCKFFDTKSNHRPEALASYGLWAKCQIVEKIMETCEIQMLLLWPETKFNRTIGKEENRRIKLD